MATRSEIGRIASARTKKQFADELSRHTSLTSEEIKTLFPKKSDREALLKLVKIVNSDADEKQKKAELVGQIGAMSGVVLKLVEKFVPGI